MWQAPFLSWTYAKFTAVACVQTCRSQSDCWIGQFCHVQKIFRRELVGLQKLQCVKFWCTDFVHFEVERMGAEAWL